MTFTHTEVLENGEVATRPLRKCSPIDHLILSDHPIAWSPAFTFHGFRYVQVDFWPSSSAPIESSIEALVLHTDIEQTGFFTCSDEMVNKLHQNIQWGMRGNFLSIPTDCPQRDERLGWTGDIQIFSPTASFLYNTSGMLSSWLKDLAAEQTHDYAGITPLVVPNILKPDFMAQAAWGDAAVIVPFDLYTAFGDREILRSQHASMKAWLEKGIPRQANGLWDPHVHQLGDWLDPDAPPSEPGRAKTDPHLVANAYLAHISAIMARVSSILDLKDDAVKYEAESTKIKKLFQEEYITSTGRLAPDTMTSLSLGLTYSLFPTPIQAQAAAERLAQLVRKSRFRISTGFVGTPLVCPALSSSGYSQLAYGMLLEKKCPSWMYPITMGATTMWERWDSMLPDGSINPGEMTSFNHYALGSVGAWLHSTVGGISPSPEGGEGWRVIKFEPIPGGKITSAEVKYNSPYGTVECKWNIEAWGSRRVVEESVGSRAVRGNKFKMTAKIPPNSRGIVKLPGVEEVQEVGSGVHEFETEYREPGEWPPKAILDPFAQYDD